MTHFEGVNQWNFGIYWKKNFKIRSNNFKKIKNFFGIVILIFTPK